MDEAVGVILMRRQDRPDRMPTWKDGPEGSELQFGDEYVLVLNPGEKTTTVEVRSARTGAHLETLSVECQEPEELATELEHILRRHAGPDA